VSTEKSGSEQTGRPPAALPIVVRRAQPGDADAILSFARTTWNGWDYIPLVWHAWLAAADGVLLVATPRPPGPGEPPELDRFGRVLAPDRPIAMTRMAMLSADEAWLEGLRVDPGVRNRNVGSLIHAASMTWARVNGACTVRYATGERNEGSHRIGDRFGFQVVGGFRSYEDPETPDEDDRPPMTPPGAAAPGREQVAESLRRTGLVLTDSGTGGSAVGAWWDRVAADPTFRASHGLYERRAWSVQAFTTERFAEHVRAGEVLAREDGDRWALAVVPSNPGSPFDESPHASLFAGDAGACLEIATAVREALGGPIRLRFPDPDPPMLRDHEAAYAAAGFLPANDAMHVLERSLAGAEDLAGPADAPLLEFADEPRHLAAPRAVGT
jgi:GNAT superfamily N-acetyltransferase